MEVVAGSVSQRSSLLDFTLAGDLVSQQVVRVQIETNSAPLHSTPHTLRALAAPLWEEKSCRVFFFLILAVYRFNVLKIVVDFVSRVLPEIHPSESLANCFRLGNQSVVMLRKA